MKENKFITYFLYATGEIILVVVGILIALKIDGWTEEKRAREQETQYLIRLIEENTQNIETFSSQITELTVGMNSVTNFSKALNNSAIADSLLIKSARDYNTYGSIIPVFSPSRSTFDDLSNTGNLQVIKDQDVRNKIIQHYTQIDLTKERLKVNNEWALKLDGPFQVEYQIMQYEKSTAHLFPDIADRQLAQNLRNGKMAYINNASAHYWINSDAISVTEKLIEQTNVLIQEMESYLELIKID